MPKSTSSSPSLPRSSCPRCFVLPCTPQPLCVSSMRNGSDKLTSISGCSEGNRDCPAFLAAERPVVTPGLGIDDEIAMSGEEGSPRALQASTAYPIYDWVTWALTFLALCVSLLNRTEPLPHRSTSPMSSEDDVYSRPFGSNGKAKRQKLMR